LDYLEKKDYNYVITDSPPLLVIQQDLLSCIYYSISCNITLGNDSLVTVQGKGPVPILTKQNVKKDINNVYHVPNLKHNLLSVGQLIEHGYKVVFEGASCRIYDKTPTEN
jgi:hypothetical protein